MDNFKENLRFILNENKLSQNKLAKLLAVSQPTVNSWCTGNRQPNYETLIELSAILDTSPNELLSWDEQTKIETLKKLENPAVKKIREIVSENKEQEELEQSINEAEYQAYLSENNDIEEDSDKIQYQTKLEECNFSRVELFEKENKDLKEYDINKYCEILKYCQKIDNLLIALKNNNIEEYNKYKYDL